MKRLAVLTFLASAALHAAEIPNGTHVLLRMLNSVNTRTAVAGNLVYLETAIPIAIGGQIVVPAGSYVQGTVSMSKRGGRVSGRAQLAIRLDTLTLPSGKMLHISPRLDQIDSAQAGRKVEDRENTIQQGSPAGKDVQRIAILAGSGAALGASVSSRSDVLISGGSTAGNLAKGAAIGAGAGSVVGLAAALVTRGADLELAQGSTMDVIFDRDVTIE